jgi:hypothetical protein
MCSNCRHFEK